MPQGFTKSLETVSPKQVPYDVGQTQNTAASLGQTAETLSGSLVSLFQNRVLGKVAVAAQDVVSQTSGYQKIKDTLLEGIVSTEDKGQFESYLKQLNRLKSGEVQGALSPSAATARMNQLARTYINRSPRLAGDIRQMLKAIAGDITPDGGIDAKDPVEKARNDTISEALKNNMLPSQYLKWQQSKVDADRAKQAFEQKTALGDLNENDFRQVIHPQRTAAIADLMEGMEKDIKDGTFVKEDWVSVLNVGKAKYKDALVGQMLEYEQLTGAKFRKEIRDEIEQEADSMFDSLIKVSEAADTIEKQERIVRLKNNILQEKDYTYFRDIFGPIASLIHQSPKDIFWWIGETGKFIKKIEHGLGPNMEALKKYDPQTRLMFQMLKDGKGWDWILQRAAKVNNGDPNADSTGNTVADSIADALSLDYCSKATTETKNKFGVTRCLASQGKLRALLKRKDIHPVIKADKTTQGEIETSAAREATNLASKIPASDLASITFNPKNQLDPFAIQDKPVSTVEPKSGATFTHMESRDEGEAFVNYLNETYKLLKVYKSPKELDQWSKEVFSSFVTRNEEDGNDNNTSQEKSDSKPKNKVSKVKQSKSPNNDKYQLGENGELVEKLPNGAFRIIPELAQTDEQRQAAIQLEEGQQEGDGE